MPPQELMSASGAGPRTVAILVLPESSASVLYGFYDVLREVGTIWSSLTGEPGAVAGFDVRIVAPTRDSFTIYGGVPVAPHAALSEQIHADVVLISDLAIALDQDPRGRWPDAVDWLRQCYAAGATIGTVCTGSVLLAETGLLDGKEATIHWAFRDFFSLYYPQVRLRSERVLVPATADQRLLTTGGAASWEDLCLYLIRRYCGEAEAVRIAKVFLFGDRSLGQLPYAAMTKPRGHDDAVIEACQIWIADHYAAANPVSRMVEHSGLAERSFKRRFRAATGYAPVEYVQTLRIEEAKQQLETTSMPTDEIGAAVGYGDPAFFRRLFKRQTGITPARYRQRVRRVGDLYTQLNQEATQTDL